MDTPTRTFTPEELTALQHVVEWRIPCARCAAPARTPCRTKSGKRTRRHVLRVYAATHPERSVLTDA